MVLRSSKIRSRTSRSSPISLHPKCVSSRRSLKTITDPAGPLDIHAIPRSQFRQAFRAVHRRARVRGRRSRTTRSYPRELDCPSRTSLSLVRPSSPSHFPLIQLARVCLPHPYPILPTAAPIFRSLTPSGRPIILEFPTSPDPLSPAGLFGLPPPLFSTLSSSYFVQPTSIPLLTTLSTSPAARYLLAHLSAGVKELQRTRNACLFEYEEGEYGLGREGLMECRERLETLVDNHGAAGGVASDSEEEPGEDEDWEME